MSGVESERSSNQKDVGFWASVADFLRYFKGKEWPIMVAGAIAFVYGDVFLKIIGAGMVASSLGSIFVEDRAD